MVFRVGQSTIFQPRPESVAFQHPIETQFPSVQAHQSFLSQPSLMASGAALATGVTLGTLATAAAPRAALQSIGTTAANNLSTVARSVSAALPTFSGANLLRGASLLVRGASMTNPVTFAAVTALTFLADRVAQHYIATTPDTRPQGFPADPPTVDGRPPPSSVDRTVAELRKPTGYAPHPDTPGHQIHSGGPAVVAPTLGGYTPIAIHPAAGMLLSQVHETKTPAQISALNDTLAALPDATPQDIRSAMNVKTLEGSFSHITGYEYIPGIKVDGVTQAVPPLHPTTRIDHPVPAHGMLATYDARDGSLIVHINKADKEKFPDADRALGNSGDMLEAVLQQLASENIEVSTIAINFRSLQTEGGRAYAVQQVQSDAASAINQYITQGAHAGRHVDGTLEHDIAALRAARDHGLVRNEVDSTSGEVWIKLSK